MSAKEVLFSQDLIMGILEHLIPASDPDSQLDRGPYEYFKEVDHRDLCRRTLASVARVCRDLQGPALDALWSVIDGIGPLLLILPSVSKSKGDYSLGGPITDEDWSRFRLYAARVRTLTLKDIDRSNYALLCAVLEHCAEDVYLFPKLHVLRKLDVNIHYPPKLLRYHLLSPTLRSLNMSFHHGLPPSLAEEISSAVVPSALPLLDSLQLSSDTHRFWDAANNSYISTEFACWEFQRSQRFAITYGFHLTPSHLASVASMPNLTVLSLKIDEQWPVASLPTGLRFARLHTLQLDAFVKVMERVFPAITSDHAPLKSLSLHMCPDEEGPVTILSMIHNVLRMAVDNVGSTLKSLDLTFSDVWKVMSGSADISTFIKPLLRAQSLPRLNHFGMKIRKSYMDGKTQLKDGGDLTSLDPLWPALTSCMIVFPDSPEPACLPTVNTIAAFAQSHPHLTQLAIPFLYVPLDILTDITLPGPHLSIRELRIHGWFSQPAFSDYKMVMSGAEGIEMVGTRPAITPAQFAEILDALFPNLDLQRSWFQRPPPKQLGWKRERERGDRAWQALSTLRAGR